MDVTRYSSHERLLVAVDCIIFGFDGRELQGLLIRRGFEPEKGNWSLMGGFVEKDESIDNAASRILYKLTGLKNIYMEQLRCFGSVGRDPADRVISVCYSALIKISSYSEQITAEYEARWFKLSQIPPLIFDHGEMLEAARTHLREKAANHPVGFELLPEKFTLPQLQLLYEAIYQTTLDRRNFSRKILSLGFIKKLDEKERTSSKKGAFLFVFDKNRYKQLDKEGLRIV
jgi:ADP-ribose pyrophosphatase YjhB (NUDIX family)